MSLRSVQRIWAAHGLEPHHIHTFKLSRDPQLAERLKDVVGLYVDPPAHAVVLSVDEKSQIQALRLDRRSQPRPRCHPLRETCRGGDPPELRPPLFRHGGSIALTDPPPDFIGDLADDGLIDSVTRHQQPNARIRE